MSKELFVEEGYNGAKYYDKDAVDALLAEKDNEIDNQKWRGDEWAKACNQKDKEIESLKAMVDAGMRERRLRRALWNMTAEWAEGMGLASCNIAIKLSVKERFFYHDEANREKDIKKYRHRQIVFSKYADYCKKKAEEYR